MKNKLVMILLAAALAFAMWLYVVTVVNPEYEEEFYVPVVLDGQTMLADKGLMVTENETPTVKVVLSGNRTDLTKLSSSNIKVIADLSKTTETGEVRLNYSVSVASDNTTGAIQVVDKDPQYITLHVEREKSKQIDVNVYYSGAVPEDFIADKENAVMDYERVSITGPEPVIDQIAEARIEVDLTNRSESFSEDYRFTLCDANGEPVDADLVQTNVAEVNLTMKIQRVKEIKLVLTIIDGGGATAETSDIRIFPDTIKVSGSDKLLESLTELNLGTVDLGRLDGNYSNKFPIELPNGVTNLTGVTEAEVRIQFPNLLKRVFTVTNITAVNVPAGMEAEILTQELQITIRGPRDLMGKMTASDIHVTVDFSNAQLGNTTTKAIITVRAGFGDAGAVGTYSVSAALREPVEEDEDDTAGQSDETK